MLQVNTAQNRRRLGPRTIPVEERVGAKRRPVRALRTITGGRTTRNELMWILAVVLIAVLMNIQPLKILVGQRTESARLQQSVIAKLERVEALKNDIATYNSDEYVAEQARLRLGVIAPGEQAYRIMDPRMQVDDRISDQPLTDNGPTGPWFATVWDSLATRADGDPDGEQTSDAINLPDVSVEEEGTEEATPAESPATEEN